MRTALWAGFFGFMCLAALWSPIWGVVGYMGHYCVGPEKQWWNAPLRPLGIRYSFTLAICTAIGIAINWGQIKLRFGRSGFHLQEKLMLLFLLIAWAGTLLSPDTVGRWTVVDHPSEKLTKILIFAFMLSHVSTDLRNLNRVIWILVVGALVLGLQAYETPRSSFSHGRLNNIGGPDFAESNTLAAFLASMLAIVAIQMYRTRVLGKAVCCLAGVFATNAIVLTRSRGGFLSLLVAGCVAVTYAPRKYRAKIFLGLIIAGAGAVYLMDDQFISRFSTTTASEDERDSSAQSRLDLWAAGGRMLNDHPLGVGFGNWYQNIGSYDNRYEGKDAHNTYVKIAAELGIQGITLYLLIVGNAFIILRRVRRRAVLLPDDLSEDFTLLSFGFTLSLVSMLTCCFTISTVTMEAMWWLLILPVCLERCLDNAECDLDEQVAVAHESDQVMEAPHLARLTP